MPFDKDSTRLAGLKSRGGHAKKLEPNIKEKDGASHEEVLDHIIMHKYELSNADRVHLVHSLSNYLLPETKSVRDQFTQEEIEERNKRDMWEKGAAPTKYKQP